ncbi:hypothetical protein T310_5598, partial [Rasamsonia emersonii CBS 393.64]
KIRLSCARLRQTLSKQFRFYSHRDAHSETKTTCPVPGCGRRFRSSSGLYNHRDAHLETERHACHVPGCGRSFRSRSSYYYHKKFHSEIKKDACTKPGATDQKKKCILECCYVRTCSFTIMWVFFY